MSAIEGGLRDRFIEEALYRTIRDGLEDIGWLDDNREHLPLTLIQRTLTADEEVALNTLNVLGSSIGGEDIEIGSNLMEDRSVYFVDFYGESDAVAKHVMGDVRAILLGKCAAAEREAAIIEVFDYRFDNASGEDDNPSFVLDVDRVVMDRAHNTTKVWERHWYSLQVELLDEH